MTSCIHRRLWSGAKRRKVLLHADGFAQPVYVEGDLKDDPLELAYAYARESLAADAGKKIDGDPSPLDLQGAAPLMKSLHPGSKQHRRQLENLEDDINQALEAITPTSWL